MSKRPIEIKKEIDDVSPSFCLAKWLQVTVHLQNGQTHSCHHPGTHKVPLEEITSDPSALHNTKYKKALRKQMLEGKRPLECEYCWKIEDAHVDNLSDRIFKSSDDWAYPNLEKIAHLPPSQSVNPTYLEVSFGNECNFKCAYCAPHISSALMAENNQFGPYSTLGHHSKEYMKSAGLYPYSKDDYNPYVEAFWTWWPNLIKDLKVFRITGGEPLLNPNTFRFFKYLKNNPMPELNLAINSNLGIPKATFDKFVEEVKDISNKNLVKSLQLYTSVDTYGKNAEFVRFGLNYESFMGNVKRFLEETKDIQVIFMCTYNAFSVVNFRKFLEEVTELKKNYRDQHGNPRLILDTPYLKDPSFLSCYVLTEEFWKYTRGDLEYLKEQKDLYNEQEISKFARILTWLEGLEENLHRRYTRKMLYTFIQEYQQRKAISFIDYCPEYADFYELCRLSDNESEAK